MWGYLTRDISPKAPECPGDQGSFQTASSCEGAVCLATKEPLERKWTVKFVSVYVSIFVCVCLCVARDLDLLRNRSLTIWNNRASAPIVK